MAELIALRLIHVLAGIFWVGSGLFTAFFLAPALKTAGPAAAGAVMTGLQKRSLYTVLPVSAVLTMLSGIRLMMIVSAGNAHWFQHRSGHTYSVSAAMGILAFILSMVVARPAAVKMGKLGQAAASDGASKQALAAEMQSLQRRMTMSTMVAVVLLILAAAGMAIARYM
jgi:uncharacterized membrane protein